MMSKPRENGVVLVALLWVLAALSLLALNFAASVRIEASLAQSAGEAERDYFFARGGLEEVVYLLAFPDRDPERQSRLFPYAGGMNHYWLYQEDLVCHVALQDESGKLDLNHCSEESLARLLRVLGVQESQAIYIARRVVEWRKPARLTEADREENHSESSTANHRDFYSVEELLMVGGVTREMLYGGPRRNEQGKVELRRGLAEYVTAYLENGRVNANYAEPEVLASALDIDLDTAQSIGEERRAEPFKSASDLSQRIPGRLSGESLSALATDLSKTYCLVATAFRRGSKVRRSVKAVIRLDAQWKSHHEKLIWYDEYWPSEQILRWSESGSARNPTRAASVRGILFDEARGSWALSRRPPQMKTAQEAE
jgi:general secretion pathway protein K